LVRGRLLDSKQIKNDSESKSLEHPINHWAFALWRWAKIQKHMFVMKQKGACGRTGGKKKTYSMLRKFRNTFWGGKNVCGRTGGH